MANVFNEPKKLLLDATLDMASDVLRILLFTTSPASLSTTLKNLADVAAVLSDGAFTEAADGTYTGQGASGRLTLSVTAATKDDTADQGEIDATDPTWTGLDNDLLTGCMIFKFVTSDALSTPISFYDFSSDLQTNGGDVTVEFSATEGFFTLGG